MGESPEDKEQIKILESWLDKTSETLLCETDSIIDLPHDISNIVAKKREEYAELGFKKESIQTQINRFLNGE